jgi:cytochrome c peroxidase
MRPSSVVSHRVRLVVLSVLLATPGRAGTETDLDRRLIRALHEAGFTGNIESTLEPRVGRPLDQALVELGRQIYFDPIQSLHGDNSCAGCHTPAFGFGDSQSIAIGVDNNGIVGPDRGGPRNQRKAPPVVNSAFFPKQMLNGRFVAVSGDPFDNSQGFEFPDPEGTTRFPPGDPEITTLLAAQGHIPQTELVEMAGFTGTAGTIGPAFDPFDDGHGAPLPPPDASGFRNEPIRDVVLARFNASDAYRALFGDVFNGGVPLPSGGITFSMIGRALAEFQISLTFADAPIDRYARGDHDAMSAEQKRGALLFFGKARCVECHAVAGAANEMFSDFENHVLGVPQIAPEFGVGTGNVIFDGPGRDEDFGREQISGDEVDRYSFRTSPLRNCAVQPAFFHNGCFTRLEDAIGHHLDARRSARNYDARRAGVDADLTRRLGPMQPVLERLDERVAEPIDLRPEEFNALVAFVRDGLLDPRALPENLCHLVPAVVPSGLEVARFQGCGCCDAERSEGSGRETSPASPSATRTLPGKLLLSANPAGRGRSLSFTLPGPGVVEVRVYDANGRLVRRLASGGLAGGSHSITWDGRDDLGSSVAAGVYFVVLDADKDRARQKIVIIR